MVTTIEALFDGTVLRPVEPLPLEPNTRVRITIETLAETQATGSFLRTARALNLSGPSDWAACLDQYLYEGKDPGDG
jgi:hypothetical protein